MEALVLIRSLIVTAAVVIGVSLLGWNLFVRPSRLVIESEAGRFPIVSGANLERQEFEFPRDFAGQLNLLFIPFLQEQQFIVNTWLPFAQELETDFPGLVYYELPTIERMPILARTFINEGMRAGIPDLKARQRTVTLYIDTNRFRQALDIPGKDQVHILLVDHQGQILWRTTGRFDRDKAKSLVDKLGNTTHAH